MFVDSDDWLDLNCCETMIQTASKYDSDVVMCSYVKEFGSNAVTNHIFEEDFVLHGTEVQNTIRRRLFGPIGKELCRPQDCDILVTPCMQLFKSEKFASVRFEDIKKTGTFEDGLYQIDLYKGCNCFAYIDKPFYHYRKTNEASICTAYKKDLYQKWEYLYGRIDERIKKENLSPIYEEALSNRVALGVLPLGLNEAVSDDSVMSKSKVLHTILSLPRYEDALRNLDSSLMGIPWKVFFYLLIPQPEQDICGNAEREAVSVKSVNARASVSPFPASSGRYGTGMLTFVLLFLKYELEAKILPFWLIIL